MLSDSANCETSRRDEKSSVINERMRRAVQMLDAYADGLAGIGLVMPKRAYVDRLRSIYQRFHER